MIGWLIFLILAPIAWLLLWRIGRLDRAGSMLVASALFVAAAGYAWQGMPGLPGAPAAGHEQHGLKQDTVFAVERLRLLGRFGATTEYLGSADAMNRIGEDRAAVTILQTGIGKHPRDADLRIGLAHALFVQADGTITPAVELAFDQAQAIDPAYPAPRYFRGLMALEAGDIAGAEQRWRSLYDSLPPAHPWKPVVASRLAAFDAVRAGKMPGGG
jgi:cytochrome c-type biogenesis protein CcmH